MSSQLYAFLARLAAAFDPRRDKVIEAIECAWLDGYRAGQMERETTIDATVRQ